MLKLRSFISIGISLLALLPGLAANAAPAQAASKRLLVDDDKTQCPKATFTSIQAAVDSLGPNPTGTITVCAGTYLETVTIQNANRLKLVGKKGAIITPILTPFDGVLVTVITSTNVTVQGFLFNGQGQVGTGGGGSALMYVDTSGVIRKNVILNWHTPGYATSSSLKPLYLTNSGGQKVIVTGNTIADSQTFGIFAEGYSSLNISKNKIGLPAVGTVNPPVGIMLSPIGSGTPSGFIKGNKLTSNSFPAVDSSTAIGFRDVGNFKVSGNIITHWRNGIFAVNDCTYPSDTTKLTITGNKLFEVGIGIGSMVTGNSCNAYGDFLRVTGNKVVDTQGLGNVGIGVQVSGSSGTGYIQNAVIKGNKIVHFSSPLLTTPGSGGVVTGVFAPNSIVP